MNVGALVKPLRKVNRAVVTQSDLVDHGGGRRRCHAAKGRERAGGTGIGNNLILKLDLTPFLSTTTTVPNGDVDPPSPTKMLSIASTSM